MTMPAVLVLRPEVRDRNARPRLAFALRIERETGMAITPLNSVFGDETNLSMTERAVSVALGLG